MLIISAPERSFSVVCLSKLKPVCVGLLHMEHDSKNFCPKYHINLRLRKSLSGQLVGYLNKMIKHPWSIAYQLLLFWPLSRQRFECPGGQASDGKTTSDKVLNSPKMNRVPLDLMRRPWPML